MEQELLEILKAEVKPALGCTGPIGVCFAGAQAYDAVGGEIKKIQVKIDWGMASKIDDVAFPGSEMLGVEMAVALGAVCGDAKAGLEVLHSVTEEGEKKARSVAELVEIIPMWDRTDLGLYVDVTVESDNGTGRAIIAERSDGLIYKSRNGKIIVENEKDPGAQESKSPILKYKVKDFYDFADKIDIQKLNFIKDAVRLNTTLANEAVEKNLGIGIGKSLMESSEQYPDNAILKAKAYAAAGCEARMSGAENPAMSCANKGNVGIAASMPLVGLAEKKQLEAEKLYRSVALSYLTAIAIIHRIGKCPSMCSCEVAAAVGIAAGSTYLLGGTEKQMEMAIQNTLPNVFGVVCDGAKLACALRISSGTGIAIEAAELAVAGIGIANNQGVLAKTADESIDLLGKTALYGMVDSDRELCKMLFDKRRPFPLQTFRERQKQ